MNALWLALLLSSVIWAEEEYFHISLDATWTPLRHQDTTWDNARNHCRACFKELTTVTSRNAHLIVQQNVSLDYWIGLHKIFNGTIPWYRWSNNQPVTYQNWYPGHPLQKVKKMISKCPPTTQSPVTSSQTSTATSTRSSSQTNNTATCPIMIDILRCLNVSYDAFTSYVHNYTYATPQTTTYSTPLYATTTESPATSTCNCNCELEPDPEVYIEDACVVLLSFGMWKEINCNESRPFICYDDRFLGQINISDVTTSDGHLSWSNPPGNITHYRVEITAGDQKIQTSNETVLYKQIQGLTPGNLYSVQVFPVKCGRDLNPLYISFYTKPAAVKDLTVVSVTAVDVSLKWSKPDGDCESYSVLIKNLLNNSEINQKCESVQCTITGLTPGNEYDFTVKAIVNKTTEGVASSVSDYTMPSSVINLTSANNDSTVITAYWDQPCGEHTGYCYCIYEGETCPEACCTSVKKCKITKNKLIKEENKEEGTRYCLCVAALTNNDILPGEAVEISAYTRPNTVKLSLKADSQYIYASWTIKGKFEKFNVMIVSPNISLSDNNVINGLRYTNHNFTSLKAGVMYTVTVVTINGNLSSEPAIKSDYTRPISPRSAKTTKINKNTIEVTWESPAESAGALIWYRVDCVTEFWKENFTEITDKTNKIFFNLRQGTKYNFSVSVVADNLISSPACADAKTDPEKRTLTLAMLCSSETPHYCANNKNELFSKLNYTFKEKLNDLVHWKLKWVERPVNNP